MKLELKWISLSNGFLLKGTLGMSHPALPSPLPRHALIGRQRSEVFLQTMDTGLNFTFSLRLYLLYFQVWILCGNKAVLGLWVGVDTKNSRLGSEKDHLDTDTKIEIVQKSHFEYI